MAGLFDFLSGLGNMLGAATYTRPQDIQAVRGLLPRSVDTTLANTLQSPAANDALGVLGMGPAVGIVPPAAGKAFGISRNLPQTETFNSAVANTPGARIEDGSLVMPVTRNQSPNQAMNESLRGGVFYLPQGSKDAKYYTGTGHNFAYGGSENISGETAFNNPLFVKGATGGKAPENAFDTLYGKGAYQNMRSDALRSTGAYYLSKGDKTQLVSEFLQKYAPELDHLSSYIVNNTTKGNQLAYALQEAAVASAARKAGYDSVLGYSVKRSGSKQPFISEVLDTRESHYPSPSGAYQTWPLDMFGQQK